MLVSAHPKLPMRNKQITRDYYIKKLGFSEMGSGLYEHYLMVKKDNIELHFFLFPTLNPLENDGQVYIRTVDIVKIYQTFIKDQVEIHPSGLLENKPWGQKEFSLLDPDHNLLTFGEGI